MASYRIKLSDGTTTINLYDGTDSQVMEGGLNMPPPVVDSAFIGNPAYDGDRLSRSRYRNRTITLTTKIYGSSLADLKTNIRSIHRLLNDAQERVLLGYGSQVYLEYQWGDTADQSTFFDVLRGDLILPPDYLSTALSSHYYILNAQLRLICSPFGRYTNQDIAQATLENTQSTLEMQTNYLVDDDGEHTMNAANDWEAQTFTTVGAFTAVGAAIKCYRGDADVLGDITFALYATSGSKPTGSAIATGTTSGNAISDDANIVSWLYCEFDSSVALDATTEYALVIHGASLEPTEILNWRVDSTAGYAGGQRCFSTDGGSSWTADATDDFLFAIYSATTDYNYQDITTAEAYGDVPAKMYHKIAMTDATGTGKTWVAKRSGTRRTDDLWIEGEDLTSATEIENGVTAEIDLLFSLSTSSNGMYQEFWFEDTDTTAADTDIRSWNFTITTVPRGQFRVLARVRVSTEDTNDFDHISFGVGWSYGDKSYAPLEANGDFHECTANLTWEILDLGILNLPPIAESEIATNNALELRIYLHAKDTLQANEFYKWDLDYIFLLPIDEGVVIIDDVGTADVIAIDGITDPPNVFILSATDKIEDFPDYVGKPFSLGRENTRIYVLRDDTNAVTFASDIRYQPRFLII